MNTIILEKEIPKKKTKGLNNEQKNLEMDKDTLRNIRGLLLKIKNIEHIDAFKMAFEALDKLDSEIEKNPLPHMKMKVKLINILIEMNKII